MEAAHFDFSPLPGGLQFHARAVQAGDAEIVACIAGDTNHVDSFRLNTATFSLFAQDAVYPYGAGGPNASFAFLTAGSLVMAKTRLLIFCLPRQ